jgi:hypothetical protein
VAHVFEKRNRSPVPVIMVSLIFLITESPNEAAFEVDRCDRAALEDAAEEHLVGRGHLDRLARLNDLNSLALIRHDAGQLFELPKRKPRYKLRSLAFT